MYKMTKEHFTHLKEVNVSENAEVITDFCLAECNDECPVWGEMFDALYDLRDKQGHYKDNGEFVQEHNTAGSAEEKAFYEAYERFYPYFIKNCVEK